MKQQAQCLSQFFWDHSLSLSHFNPKGLTAAAVIDAIVTKNHSVVVGEFLGMVYKTTTYQCLTAKPILQWDTVNTIHQSLSQTTKSVIAKTPWS